MISDLEATSRLTSVLSVCETELEALDRLHDPRLDLILIRMHEFCHDVAAAIHGLTNAITETPFDR